MAQAKKGPKPTQSGWPHVYNQPKRKGGPARYVFWMGVKGAPKYRVRKNDITSDAFVVASVQSIESVMAAELQSQHDYSYSDIRWGERFVDIYETKPNGELQVDYARIHDTEPIPQISS